MTLSIPETTIQHHATNNSFSRGEDYYHRGAVTDLVQRGGTIHAEVEGSEVAPYRVSLQVDSGGITSVSNRGAPLGRAKETKPSQRVEVV